MTPERWTQIQEAFDQLVILEPAEQTRRLALVSASDPDLATEVESLLHAHQRAADILDPIQEVISSPGELVFREGEQAATDPLGLVGRSVSHYEVTELLGLGGMGIVYRAHDPQLGRTVSLKFLPPHLAADEIATERFAIEARAAAALDHPNICNIHEIGRDEEGRPFIAMAYYDGETLKQKLERGPLSVDEASNYTAQITAGLAAAHAHGIVHRDVKPGNVIVTSEGVAKVLDFGLAKLADVTLTRTGMTPGTVAYMSPEHTRGQELDARTDLWSLGVVLYEMLTGRLPFQGNRYGAVIYAIRNDDPKPPSDRIESLPPGLEQIVSKLLEKAPGQRYQSADALLTDLLPLAREGLRVAGATAGRVASGAGRPSLWAQLKRRKVYHTAALYAVAAWVVVQVAETTLPYLGFPESAIRLVIVLAVLGFPVALGLAWAFEISRKGIRRTRFIDLAAARPHPARPIPVRLRRIALPAAAAAALLGALFVGSRFTGTPDGPTAADPIWILVKPFTSLGDEEEDYLAEGLVDDVRYRLSSVASLRVIARQSSMTYRETSQNVKEIGDELGVDYILDGLVRGEQTAEGNRRIRLTVALASTEDGSQVWSDAYDKPASLGSLLDMQTTIASQVAAALNLVLSERERLALIERETDTLALYYFNEALIKAGWRESDLQASLALHEKALEVDSTFVRAWGGVAGSHGQLYHFGFDRSRERLAMWKAAADRVMELDPEYFGPLVASYYYYLCCKDYERALEYLAEAGEDRPGVYDYELEYAGVLAAERYFTIAMIQRRMGAWDASIANWGKSIELDPRSQSALYNQGQNYGLVRRFEEAIRYLDRTIEAAQDFAYAYEEKAGFLVTLDGDTQEARRVLEDAAGLANQDRPLERGLFWVDVYERDYRAALGRFGGNRPNDRGSMVKVGGRVDIAQAKVHELVGDQERARIHFDSARIEMQTRLTALPPADSSGRANVRILLAEAYAGLGLREEALLEAAAAEQLMPVTRDAVNGPDVMLEAAYFYTQIGDYEAALDRIEHLLSIPSRLTTHHLRLNPFWDPLRGDPRFQALLEES